MMMMMSVEQSVEIEVIGENITQPLCPPQIPHDMTWAGAQAAAVESQ
jgi:hypothetical protein